MDSPVSHWNYFIPTGTGDSATCTKCGTVIKVKGGTTTGIRYHLKSQHGIILSTQLKRTNQTPELVEHSASKHPKLTSFFQKKRDDTFPAIAARMTARDGLPFSKFCTSTDLRNLLTAAGHRNIPKSANTIREIVCGYGDKMKKQVISEISKHKLNGEKFSATFDEWTSLRNRRYMNVIVHTEKEF